MQEKKKKSPVDANHLLSGHTGGKIAAEKGPCYYYTTTTAAVSNSFASGAQQHCQLELGLV